MSDSIQQADRPLVLPSLPTHGLDLIWNPQPFIATVTHTGIYPHPEPADPSGRTYLAAEISRTQFFRFASYYPSATHDSFIDLLHRWTLDSVYLLSDGKDDEIYTISYSAKWGLFLFGKLARDNEIFRRCALAFAGMI